MSQSCHPHDLAMTKPVVVNCLLTCVLETSGRGDGGGRSGGRGGRGRGRGFRGGRGRGSFGGRGFFRDRAERGQFQKDSDSGHGAGLYLGDNADGEKLANRIGAENMNKLVEAFEEMSERVLPSPAHDIYLDAFHTNLLVRHFSLPDSFFVLKCILQNTHNIPAICARGSQ